MPRRHFFARMPAGLRLAIALAVSAPLLGACNNTGDFGRPRYPWATPSPPIAVADPLPTGTAKVSNYPLTDDERELRKFANNVLAGPAIIEPATKRFAVYGMGGVDPAAAAPLDDYPARIVNGPFRSATARYARLIDDTRSDIQRLDQFFAVARRVADMDRRREKSLAHVTGLGPDELLNARRRIRENMMLMVEVQRLLGERAAMYRYTLERLVIALPSPTAVEAERIRKDFERRLTAIQVIAEARPPPQGVVVNGK
jgi:hypothetical protein